MPLVQVCFLSSLSILLNPFLCFKMYYISAVLGLKVNKSNYSRNSGSLGIRTTSKIKCGSTSSCLTLVRVLLVQGIVVAAADAIGDSLHLSSTVLLSQPALQFLLA